MKLAIYHLLILLSACSEKQVDAGHKDELLYNAVVVKENNRTPSVDIDQYLLVTHQQEKRENDAREILKLKRDWPLVMQAPNRIGFDTLLSRNFTFTGDGRVLNREDYIRDRLAPSDWKITHVKYENLSLQFFGNVALLTYRNEVKNEHLKTGEVEIEYIHWADIYVLEENKWKIGGSHTIDVKVVPDGT